jgi:hypothetical protein
MDISIKKQSVRESFAPSDLESLAKLSDFKVTCVGAGYVGALTAITMACKNPST